MTGANRQGRKSKPAAPAKAGCPICHRRRVSRFTPFCSRRCADVDLVRWLDGHYVIPGDEHEAPAVDSDTEPT